MIANENIIRSIRILVGVVFGYLFTAGVMTILSTTLPYLGLQQSDATLLAIIFGFLAYIIVLLWIVVTPNLTLVSFIAIALASAMIFTSMQLT